MPIKYLLALQREALIFLALIGGVYAKALIRSSLKFYGDPSSLIYKSQSGRANIIVLLQHLKVLIRCLGRVGEPSDRHLLDNIINRAEEFKALHHGDKFTDKIA